MISDRVKIFLGFILICLIWGSTWLAIRIGLTSLTPAISAGIRFLLASLFVLILVKINKLRFHTDAASLKLYLFLGIFGFAVPFGLVYWAEQFIPSGLASILFAVMPFGIILFSKILLNSKISSSQVLGVIIGFLGIVIIFSENLVIEFSEYFLGMLAVLLSSIIQSAVAVVVKKNGQHLHPLSINFLPLLIGGLIMTTVGVAFENKSGWIFDLKAIGSIFYLAFFGTVVTFTTYYWLLKKMNIVILSLNAFITPIVAVILGWIILGENFSIRIIAGTVLVLMGILFANLRRAKKISLNKN